MVARDPRRSFWESLGETQTAISLILLYGAVMFLLRFALSPNLNGGEAAQMLFGQSLQWNYLPDRPPLMTWLSWAALRLGQDSRLALFLLREILLVLGLIAFFFSARRVLGERRRAALAVMFLAATFGLGWLAQAGRPDTVLLACMCCFYLWAGTRALLRGRYFDYAVLGLVTGVGVLASYVFLVLPFAMSVALALTPEWRARLRPVPLMAAAAIAALIVGLYFAFAPAAAVSSHDGRHAPLAAILGSFAIAFVLFALPAVLIFVALYRRACMPLPPQDRAESWLRFLKITMLTALIVALLAMLLVRRGDAEASWIYPVLLPLPIYLFLRTQLAQPDADDGNDRIFVRFVLACIVAGIGVRVWMYQTRAHDCRHCAEYWPLARYADTFRQAGFVTGTIVAPRPALAGNLRLVFPEARVVTPDAPARRFGAPVRGECLVVWDGNDANISPRLRDYVETTYGAKLQERAMQGDVEAALLKGKGRRARMNFLILADGACDRPRA
ncbi:MAG: glycosyltransferase family 39 protein [Alphaproteobacteria bacterium]|nr:glycosyltransferase family 39 protein [Alphaproteobacteria bacterium]